MTITYAQVLTILDKDEKEIIEGLAEYYDSGEELLTAIANDDSDLSDHVNEWADGEVDVYTGRVYEWIGKDENYSAVCEYEEEAIKEMGATTIEKIGQWCQYRVAETNAQEAVAEVKKILDAAK